MHPRRKPGRGSCQVETAEPHTRLSGARPALDDVCGNPVWQIVAIVAPCGGRHGIRRCCARVEGGWYQPAYWNKAGRGWPAIVVGAHELRWIGCRHGPWDDLCPALRWGVEHVEGVGAARSAGVLVGTVSVVKTNLAKVCMLTWFVVVEGVVRPISGCCPAVVCLAVVWQVMVSWRSLLPA